MGEELYTLDPAAEAHLVLVVLVRPRVDAGDGRRAARERDRERRGEDDGPDPHAAAGG